MTRDKPTADWDPLAHGAVDHPIREHERLRREAPVAYSERWGGFWALTRYDDVIAATEDTETFSSHKANPSTRPDDPPRPPLEIDPPAHNGYRRLLNPYFAPRFIRAFEPEVRRLAVEIVQDAVDKGTVDAVEHITFPAPVRVLCAFLGIPDADAIDIKTWAVDVIAAAREGNVKAHESANAAIYGYIEGVVAERRENPRDPSEDLISGLIFGTVELEPLTDDEIAGILRLLLAAGHGTTTLGIGSTLRYLAENPEEQQRLRENPGLLPAAIEEILRVWSPSRALGRVATKDVEVAGRRVRAGDRVSLVWSSANRDQEVFENADEVVIGRRPNRHIAFGHGIHTCLGAPLARTELRIFAEEVLRRTTAIRLAGPPHMANWPSIGPDALPLTFEAVS